MLHGVHDNIIDIMIIIYCVHKLLSEIHDTYYIH